MEKEMYSLIRECSLSPFSRQKMTVAGAKHIFRTRDARAVYEKVLSKISELFYFKDTQNLFLRFSFTPDGDEIKRRQEFFKSVNGLKKDFLKKIFFPRALWKPKYDILAVTENEGTLLELQKLGCPVQFIMSENDVLGLDKYDIIQAIDCDNFGALLEQIPQTVFIKNSEDIYLERFLIELSGWKDNLITLKENRGSDFEIVEVVNSLLELFALIDDSGEKTPSRQELGEKIEEINEEIFSELKKMTITGESLVSIIGKGKIPEEIEKMIEKKIKESNIPPHLINVAIPITIDEKELDRYVRNLSINRFTDSAEIVKKNAEKIRKIPEKLKKISAWMVYYDFISGVSEFISDFESYPEVSDEFYLNNSKNIFLDNPQAVNFNLNSEYRCSILTGANSGGKTTLLEHIIQILVLFNLGFPIYGSAKIPIFSDVYYFAKNKGSANKGAFETLLTQMSKINPGEKTLILADEIESVTEPKVAGKIISATAEFFLERKCYLVIATHLGHEIQKSVPLLTRIDGIEAKGLDENFNLIVDHNPVLGRLANSTPELIIEKMAGSEKHEYFVFIHGKIRQGQ